MYVADAPWEEPDGSLNMICTEINTTEMGQVGRDIEKVMDIDSSYEIQLVVTAIAPKSSRGVKCEYEA